MKKPELDLTDRNCHVCGNPLIRNITKGTEMCIYFFCQIRDIDFSIPYKEVKDDSKS